MPAPGASPRATSCSRTRGAGPQTSVEMVITRPSGVGGESFSTRAAYGHHSQAVAGHCRCRARGVPWSRVTFAIATWNGEAFIREAVESCLAQTYADLEVLVVDDGSTDSTPSLLEELACDRLRVVRHETNRGIAAAYDTIVQEARGELIARLGHDDIALPDRIARQVAVFDRHPETGVVHGDAVTIDGAGRTIGSWRSGDYPRRVLIDLLVRRLNNIVDPSSMLHRRVHDADRGLRRRVPDVQRLRLLAAGGTDVPLPPRRRRAADPVPPPRRELLRRVASSPGAERGRGRAAQEPRGLAARRPRARARLGRAPPAVGRAPRMPRSRRGVRRPRPARARVGVASPRRPGAARAVAPRSPVVRTAHRALVLRVRRRRRRNDRPALRRQGARAARPRGDGVRGRRGEARRRAGLRAAERGRGWRRGRVGAQPAARAARPGPSPSRARRSSDPGGVRGGPRSGEARRRAPPQPAQPRALAGRRDVRAGHPHDLLDPQLLAGMRAELPVPRRPLACATGPATQGARAPRASARATPPAMPSAGASCASGSRCGSTASSRCRRRCGARWSGSASRRRCSTSSTRRCRRTRRSGMPSGATAGLDGGSGPLDGRLRRLGLSPQGASAARRGGAAGRLRPARPHPRRGPADVRRAAPGARPARSRRARRRVLALGAARRSWRASMRRSSPRSGGTVHRSSSPSASPGGYRWSPRTWAESPTSSSTAATGCCSTGARRPRSRPRSSSSRTSPACSSGCRAASRPRSRSRRTSTSSRRSTPAIARCGRGRASTPDRRPLGRRPVDGVEPLDDQSRGGGAPALPARRDRPGAPRDGRTARRCADAARARGGGAPPVAARPLAPRGGKARADPAMGVRIAAARLAGRPAGRCRRGVGALRVHARDVSRGRRGGRPRARRPERRGSRDTRRPTARARSFPMRRCASCSSAARSPARGRTCCCRPSTRRSRDVTTCCW